MAFWVCSRAKKQYTGSGNTAKHPPRMRRTFRACRDAARKTQAWVEVKVANDMENKERVLQTRARQAEARGQSRGSVPVSTLTTAAGDGLGAASRGEPGRRTRGGDGDTRPVPHSDRRAAQPALGGHGEGVRSLHHGEEKGLGSPSQHPGCKGQLQGQGQPRRRQGAAGTGCAERGFVSLQAIFHRGINGWHNLRRDTAPSPPRCDGAGCQTAVSLPSVRGLAIPWGAHR